MVADGAAVWFPRAGAVEFRKEPLRPLQQDEVLVRTLVSGISHGTEMLVLRGQVPRDLELDLPGLRGGYGFPIKFGYAAVGRVEGVGERVEHPVPGDLVFVHHPHQTAFITPASSTVLLPSDLAPELGVFVANLETAVNVMLDAAPRIGERVAVFGQGVVGLLLTQLLRTAGVGLIAAVDPIPARRQLALRLGAHTALEPGQRLVEHMQALAGGAGFDLAIEASGSAQALDQALGSLAFQGTAVVCSWYGAKTVQLALGAAFHRRRLRVISSQVGHVDPALHPRWDSRRRLGLVVQYLSRLNLVELITHRVPFERAEEAYGMIDSHPEQTVQVVLTYGDGHV